MISRTKSFLETDVWRIRTQDLPRGKAALVRYLRIILAASKSFGEHRCQLRASALTFYSLLAIVPVAAMAFGIAKGFQFDKLLQAKILERFPGQEAVLLEVFGFADNLLRDTKGGLIAGVGVILLFWSVIKVLGNIEESLNDIWGVPAPRSVSRKVTDYLSVMLVAPGLLVIAGSLTVFVATQLATLTQRIDWYGILGPVVHLILKLTPFAIMWVLFSFVYLFIPNRSIRYRSGVFAGIVAGTAYQLMQVIYVTFQVGVAKYNAIYGSFAALPLFLGWLQLSWLIVLAGAEISCQHQNVDRLEFAPDAARASAALKRLVALRVVNYLCQNFTTGNRPAPTQQIGARLDIPLRLAADVTRDLVDSGVLVEVADPSRADPAYLPARDPDLLTIKYVIDALDRRGVGSIPIGMTEEVQRIAHSLEVFGAAIEKSPDNRRLKDI
ncbi:MAG TPA: YihY/virulence factor BrkB family protein [Candidatus Baltobacteraceae bacterium]|nr:YihY/virulence factor BrkB family protein [Candidatus Baltobacteraceae bacterium]